MNYGGQNTCKKCGKMSYTFIGDIHKQLCSECRAKREKYLKKRYAGLEALDKMLKELNG